MLQGLRSLTFSQLTAVVSRFPQFSQPSREIDEDAPRGKHKKHIGERLWRPAEPSAPIRSSPDLTAKAWANLVNEPGQS
jgi:hypothetical protein